jgi:hypothetical protein
LDLVYFASIHHFSENFVNNLSLFGFICNEAGGSGISREIELTEDSIEMIFGTNYLGQFLLSNLLLPNISDNSRILFVSSEIHNSFSLIRKYFKFTDRELLVCPKKTFHFSQDICTLNFVIFVVLMKCQ